ncbi:hypothetical protein QBC47DRAFT_395161 [Echria macrotheca]|uniref:GST N-terminal domain-containing protein n=1 Tax=Echria macrotheca TaxID=438768 RepID=A0AAJ0B1I5_9PEZI|nr:hypothetical protein QBC47DRAFT_395161 [Echria macrotheca]
MASDEIILFDLTSKDTPECWSLNPWKTRLLLNYKGVPYKTEWLNYPEVGPRLAGHVKPHEMGTAIADYTIPTVRLPGDEYVMDSRRIADVINQRYSSPPLTIDSPQLSWFVENYGRLMTPFRGVYLPLVPRRLLAEGSIAYWYESKERLNGKSLDAIEKEEGGDVAYERLEPVLKEITAMLKENSSGPFFNGAEVSYVDFFWAAWLLFAKRIGEDVLDAVIERCGVDGHVHRDLLDAVKPWSERSTY